MPVVGPVLVLRHEYRVQVVLTPVVWPGGGEELNGHGHGRSSSILVGIGRVCCRHPHEVVWQLA